MPAQQGKGSGLGRKVGPLPLWAWVLVGIVGGYFALKLIRGGSSSGASAATDNQSSASSPSPSSSMGVAPSAGSPSDTGTATSDLLSSFGSQQESLLSALEAANQDVVGLAQAQIQYAQTQTSMGSFQTQTQPLVATDPYANAPQYVYVQPSAVTAAPSAPPAASVATRSSSANTGGGQPFGGVVSTAKLKNGATLTTYASGRQVEQVPGKSPYVVKR